MRLQRLLRSMRLLRFLRPRKSLLRTSESSWILNSLIWGQKEFYFDVLKTIISSEIMKYQFSIFCTFSVGSCWGQPMLLFWKLVLIIKMSTSQNFKTIFKYNLTCIFFCLRAQLKKPLCPRTPCTWYRHTRQSLLVKVSSSFCLP